MSVSNLNDKLLVVTRRWNWGCVGWGVRLGGVLTCVRCSQSDQKLIRSKMIRWKVVSMGQKVYKPPEAGPEDPRALSWSVKTLRKDWGATRLLSFCTCSRMEQSKSVMELVWANFFHGNKNHLSSNLLHKSCSSNYPLSKNGDYVQGILLWKLMIV